MIKRRITPKIWKLLLMTTIISAGFSCTNEEALSSGNDEAISPKAYFNYSTSLDVPVNIQLKDQKGNVAPKVMIRLFFENPYLPDMTALKRDLTPNFKALSDASGRLTTKLTLPIHIDTLYAIIDGYPSPVKMAISKSGITQTLYPAGFGVKRISQRSYPTGYSPQLFNNPENNVYSNGCWILGGYEAGGSEGRPFYIDETETVPTSLLNAINTTLAEVPMNIPNNYPGLIDNINRTNLQVIDNANIWVTFVNEGAGYKNSVGYFYYKTADGPPSSVSQIFKRIMMFPNSSAGGSGGTLATGDRVKLMYCDPANDPNIAANWTDVFPAGTTVGWFIVSNGYSYGVDAPYGIHYSVFDLNGESLPQTIQLYDPTTEKIVLGFEDISRVYPAYSSDEDFNDCVFYITTNPITAVNRENLKRFDEDFGDKDGDGTPNKDDEYPDDPDRAFNNYYPNAVVFGTLAFEDNWPAKGDYDFNDLVVDYRVTYVTNTAGTVKDVILSSQVKAIGASYRNGFAWQLNASPGNISSVQTTYFGPGTLLGGSLFDLNAKGYENGQSKVVIPFFDNAFTLFGSSYIPNYPNTIIGANYYNPVSITKKITFTTPVNLASLGSLPYNPFMVVNQERGREVHKVGHPATDKASLSYFNTQEDITNRSTLWYVGANGAPWLIETPVQLEYPVAAAHIETTFLKFSSWAGSGGINHTDWYNNTSNGYREDSKIFRKN